MLVSGGKIIAIDGVNTTSATLSGDGVFTPLGVNTDNVATKKFVTDNLNTVSSKLTNTDNYLSAAIDYVSANAGKTYKPGAGIEIDNNNVVSISSDYIDAITSVSAIKGTIITGDSNFNITSSNSGKNILWNLELTSQPVVTDTTLSGYNGIIARKDSTVSSQWNVGLDGTYKSAIEQVSGKLDKSDSAKFYPITNPSGFITGIPTSSNWDSVYSTVNTNSGTWNNVSAKVDTTAMSAYYKKNETSSKEEIDNEFNATSAWANVTFLPSGDYLSANALDNLSGRWENASDKVEANSSYWNETTQKVNDSANTWNTVTAKADQTDLETLSSNVETISSKLDNKLNKNDFTAWSATIDTAFYSAGDGLALNDHQFYVSGKYITSAGETLAGKMLILKDNEWVEMPEFGGFATANSGEGHPDVQNPSTKLIYLVKNSSVTGNDKYSEWIYTSADAQTTAWECIGDTSLDLTPYLTKTSADTLYQQKGDYVTSSTSTISANKNYALTNDGTNVKWVELEDKDTTYSAGNYIEITNDNTINVSGLHNTTLTSTNGSIGITATTAANGDVEYDLGVHTIPSISGINGVSAYYDEAEDQYVVGLDDYNDIGFAKYSSDTIYYSSNDNTLKSLHEDLNLNQEKIALVDDKIILQPGLYHVDMQVLLSIGNSENVYYETTITTIPAEAAITQIIDASYEHSETVDLSFDIKIAEATELNATITDFKTGSSYQLINLNIHEIVSMPSQVEGGASNYVAGRGISIDNDTIEAKIGNGLEFNGNNIQVKLGDGLKFDNTQGVQAVTIDNDVEAVVQTVQKMEEDLDTKVTVNFDYANITDKFDFSTYGDTTGQGNLLGYLFAVPINNKIYAESSVDTSGNPTKYVTKIGVYSHQTYTQNYIILGLYEYDPNFEQKDSGGTVTGYGRTVPFCDTGARQLSQGLNEFTITHLNDKDETKPELKSSCLYYATIYISKNPGNGVNLAGCPGYATTFNTNPQITLDQTNVNVNLMDEYPVQGKTRDQVSFNDMGWGSWAGQQNYHELPSAPRFFMQISNKVRPTI